MADVESAVAKGHPADAYLTAAFRRHREWGSRDRKWFSRVIFSALRWRGWIGAFSDRGDALLLEADLLEAAERHPLLEQLAAALARNPAALKPLAAMDLDGKSEALARLWNAPAPPPERLIPDWFVAAMALPPDADPAAHLRRCIEAFQARPPVWLRAVRLSGVALCARLRGAGFAAEVGPLSVSARISGKRPHWPTLDRAMGACYEPQDIASIAVGVLAAPAAGERWWDVCGGAGGKALHLAESGAEVWCSDIRPRALAEAERRARRVGGLDIRFFSHDGERPLSDSPTFDGVLVDAPCSGVGTWSRCPDARWRTGPEGVAAFAARQRRLLENAAAHVRPGGRLVYSVCTLTASETLAVVERFGAAHPEFEPEHAPHPLHGGNPMWPIWVWPWEGPGGGMFIARWRNRAGG